MDILESLAEISGCVSKEFAVNIVTEILDTENHGCDEERRILAIYEHFEGAVGIPEIEQHEECQQYGMPVFEVGAASYAVATDEEADDAWDSALDNYLEECIYPELPEPARSYFDVSSWKRDAKFDGRGHALSSFDGCEYECREFFIYRVN